MTGINHFYSPAAFGITLEQAVKNIQAFTKAFHRLGQLTNDDLEFARLFALKVKPPCAVEDALPNELIKELAYAIRATKLEYTNETIDAIINGEQSFTWLDECICELFEFYQKTKIV